jgi:hypothetical protein
MLTRCLRSDIYMGAFLAVRNAGVTLGAAAEGAIQAADTGVQVFYG